jgi:hypothetical protein
MVRDAAAQDFLNAGHQQAESMLHHRLMRVDTDGQRGETAGLTRPISGVRQSQPPTRRSGGDAGLRCPRGIG